MFFHVMLGANDLEASRLFYDATFEALGIPCHGRFREEPEAYMYGTVETGLFFVTKPQNGKSATFANGGTVMFKASSRSVADVWYQTGIANGGSDVNGPPGPGALPDTIMGYLRDPAGNKIAVVAFD